MITSFKSDLFRWRLSEKYLNLKSDLFWHPPEKPLNPTGFQVFAMQKAWFSIGFNGFSGGCQKDYISNLSTFHWRAIEKCHFLKIYYFHDFAFSDRGEDISDLRKNYAFGKPIPKKYFPEMRNQLRSFVQHTIDSKLALRPTPYERSLHQSFIGRAYALRPTAAPNNGLCLHPLLVGPTPYALRMYPMTVFAYILYW